MNVSELFRRLAVGELSNLSLADSTAGTIQADQHAKLVLHINDGLMRLHTRFLLKESDLVLRQRGYLINYPLTAKYAVTNQVEGAGHTFYIEDSVIHPFQDDLIKVLEVWNVFGNEVPLNDEENPGSVFTPQPNVLQIPRPKDMVPLTVHYQAAHPQLSADHLDQEIDIPLFLEGALSSFVAGKVFTHMNTQENTAKGAEHAQLFDTICIEAVDRDLISTLKSSGNARFERRGWK
jgi:hypothetical protein